MGDQAGRSIGEIPTDLLGAGLDFGFCLSDEGGEFRVATSPDAFCFPYDLLDTRLSETEIVQPNIVKRIPCPSAHGLIRIVALKFFEDRDRI